ncbi:MAG: hypothetical protein Q4C49_10140 [Bacillota bacterium]|nr:hypothetical protein [Bacillota bacterium]
MKTKQEIIQEVLDQMTGDALKDIETIVNVLEENQDHPEIEAIGFELLSKITDRIPDKAKSEMARMLEENHKACENQLADVEELIDDHLYEEALEKIENLFRCFEMLKMFNEDNIFRFYTFEDGLQESVYRVIHGIQTPTGNAPENYGKAYHLYGKALLGLNRTQEAKEKFNCAMRWNPMQIASYIGYAQALKVEQDLDGAKEFVCKAFRYAFKKEDIGNIYCFLSGLYLDLEEYEVAYYSAFFAGFFARKSKANKYINRVKDACPYELKAPEPERVTTVFEQYKIEKAPGEEMLQVLFSIANYCEKHNRLKESLFVWNTIYELIEDEASVKKIDALEDAILEKFESLIQEYAKDPCERKFNRILFEMHNLKVYAALKKDSKDEYAIATRDGQPYFVLFTKKEIDPALLKEYSPVKVSIEQVIQWAYRSQEEVNGIIFNPEADGFTFEVDELKRLIGNTLLN